MKKLLLFGLGVITSLSVLTSCKKDEVAVAGPTVSFANNENSYTATKESDTNRLITVTVNAPGELSTIKIYEVKSTGRTSLKTITDFTSKTNHVFTYNIISKPNTGDYKIEIEATDKKTNSSSSIFTVKTFTVTPTPTPAGDISSYSAKLLGAQNASAGSFLSTTNGLVYDATAANNKQDSIDFVYYYGGTYKSTIGAPDDKDVIAAHTGTANFSNWTKRNKTRFISSTLTAAQFDAIQNDKEMTAISSTLSDTKMTDLAVDKVFAFKTEAGKIGFVKVKSLVVDAKGSITIDVKVQK